MVLVPANMSRFGFNSYKKKLLFLVPAKYFAGTFFKIKRFCRDYFSNKWFSHHVTRVQIITKVEPGTKTKMRHICRDQKQQIFFAGTKTKTRHICRDQNHILAKNKSTEISTYKSNFELITCRDIYKNI